MLSAVVLKNQIRCLYTTSILFGEARMMKKLLNKPQKQRKFVTDDKPMLSTSNSLGAITGEGRKSINTRRINVLNKLFMRHITDLMSTGTYSNAITGHGIEINRVKVAPDFRFVRVYWLARSNELVENIEDILKSHAAALRHELTQLHVLGNVPKIEFVKDDQYTLLKLLDEKLAQADYGEDHEPADTVSRLKKDLQLQTNLESHIRHTIEQLEAGQQSEEAKVEACNLDVPAMPQNILMNHAEILQRVVKNLQKSQGLYRKSDEVKTNGTLLPNEVNHDPVSFPSMRLQREAFRQFLSKRQLMKQKLQSGEKASMNRPELDYVEEEWSKKREHDLKKYDFHEYLADENDYIDEDDTDLEKR